MDITKWDKLNWVDNHTSYYFGTKENHKQTIKKDRFALLEPEKQCNEVVDYLGKLQESGLINDDKLNLKIGQTQCYLCGMKIKQRGSDIKLHPGGHQCEHVLSMSSMSILCGLPIYDYELMGSDLLNHIKSLSSNEHLYSNFQSSYRRFQESLWPMLYKWSHPMCNTIKGDYPLLNIKFNLDELYIDNPTKNEDNIKKIVGSLFLKKTKQKTRNKKTKKNPLDKWRESMNIHTLTKRELMDKADKQKTLIGKDIFDIYQKLTSYDKYELKKYSYLSTIITIKVVVTKIFHLGFLKVIHPLYLLFTNSLSDIQAKVTEYRQALEDSMISDLRKPEHLSSFLKNIEYFTIDSLGDDVIFSAIQVLRDNESSLFNQMDIDELMINMDKLDISTIIPNMKLPLDELTDKELIKFRQFCVVFRSYLNMVITLQAVIEETYDKKTINKLFKLNLINLTNYVWNIWSKSKDIKEGVIIGKGGIVDELSSGPRYDRFANIYKDELFYQELLEKISWNYTDDISDEKISESLVEAQTMELKKQDSEPTKSDISDMKFTVENQPISLF